MVNSKKINPQDFEDKDTIWESFIEIATSLIKVAIFCVCLYIIKEIFLLLNDVYHIIQGQSLEIVQMATLPIGILFVLGVAAVYFMRKSN